MDSVVFIKIVSALLYPLGLVGVFGVAACVYFFTGRKRIAKTLLCISIGLLLVCSNPLFARFLVSQLENQFPQQSIESISAHQAIIVLGGGLRVPSAPNETAQLGSASDRYWRAARLYFAGKAPLIIISGGNVYSIPGVKSEAFYVAELLMRWGVPESAILAETDSRTTGENAMNVLNLLEQREIDSVLLVTSAMHMPRAYSLFESLPISVTPAVADVLVRDDNSPAVFSFLPSASALRLSTLALHEYYGITFNRLKAILVND